MVIISLSSFHQKVRFDCVFPIEIPLFHENILFHFKLSGAYFEGVFESCAPDVVPAGAFWELEIWLFEFWSPTTSPRVLWTPSSAFGALGGEGFALPPPSPEVYEGLRPSNSPRIFKSKGLRCLRSRSFFFFLGKKHPLKKQALFCVFY